MAKDSFSSFIDSRAQIVLHILVIGKIINSTQASQSKSCTPTKVYQGYESIYCPCFQFHAVKFKLPSTAGRCDRYFTEFRHLEIWALLWIGLWITPDNLVGRKNHIGHSESFEWFVKILLLFLFTFKSCFVCSDVIHPKIEYLNLSCVQFWAEF